MKIINPPLYSVLLERMQNVAVSGGEPVTITSDDHEATDWCCPVQPEVFSGAGGVSAYKSGVVIGSRLVLTTKHVTFETSYVKIPGYDIYAGPRIRGKPILHPTADLSILILDESAPGPFARLATQAEFFQELASGFRIAGFGGNRVNGILTDAGKRNATPVRVPASISIPGQYDVGSEFVMGGAAPEEGGVTQVYDAETGDSGGGAFLHTGGVSTVFGIDKRNFAIAGDYSRSVFTRVDAYATWVKDVALANGLTVGS